MEFVPVEPPEFLYHGTASRFSEQIERYGKVALYRSAQNCAGLTVSYHSVRQWGDTKLTGRAFGESGREQRSMFHRDFWPPMSIFPGNTFILTWPMRMDFRFSTNYVLDDWSIRLRQTSASVPIFESTDTTLYGCCDWTALTSFAKLSRFVRLIERQ